MENKYWIAKVIISGFEASMYFYGSEIGLREYISSNIPGNVSYFAVDENTMQSLMRSISARVYMCPAPDLNKYPSPNTDADVSEDDTEEFIAVS